MQSILNKTNFMKQKILAFLKGKLQGTSESYLSGIAEHYATTITEESQIETTLNDGVIDLLKLNAGILQTEGDRRATEAQKTAVKNAFEKLGLDENGKPKTPTTPPAPPIDPTSVEAMLTKLFDEKIMPLQNKIAGFEKEKTQSQLMGKLTSKLKEKGVSEKFYKGRNLNIESEDSIEQLANEIETDWNEFVQEKAEQGVVINIPQSSSGNVKEGTFGAKIAELENAGGAGGVEAKKLI